MGSQIGKSFPPPVPYGKSPNQIVTPSQPVPYIGADQGTPTPALSGYNMSPVNPMPPDSTSMQNRIGGGGGGDAGGADIHLRQRMGAPNFDNILPFFGSY